MAGEVRNGLLVKFLGSGIRSCSPFAAARINVELMLQLEEAMRTLTCL